MLSMTVILASDLVSWKVRTIPAGRACAAWSPEMSCRGNERTLSCVSNPVMRLKNVVLPAPLGPISAVIDPRWTSRWSTLTAVRPPKLRVTPSTMRIGSGLADPGVAATSSKTPATGFGITSSAVIERHLLSRSEDALWSVARQQEQPQAHQDEAHLADVEVAQPDRVLERVSRTVGQLTATGFRGTR